MSIVRRMILCVLALVVVHSPTDLYAEADRATSIVAEDDRYRIALAGEGEPRYDPETGGRVKFTFSVTDKAEGRRFPVYLDNLTSRIDSIRVFGGKLIVMGGEQMLHSSITTLISLKDRKEIDSFVGFGNKLSNTGRFLSYRMFYPPETAEPPRISDLVLVYDLNESPEKNRIKGQEAYRNDPVGRLTEVGHPVYPESNAEKKSYRVWVRDENGRHSIIPDGFFWLDDDRKIAFGDRIGRENYLIVIDLAAGLDSPVIHKNRIDIRSLLKEEDRENEALVQVAEQFRLEDVRPISPGTVRIHVSSDIPLQTNDLDLIYREAEPTQFFPSSESLRSAHAPTR